MPSTWWKSPYLTRLNEGSAKGIRLGVTLFVDPTAMMFLVGTEID